MSLAGTAWPGAPAHIVDDLGRATAITRRAALKARSVFFRRALRRVVQLSNPAVRASILILGGNGREALDLVEQCGGFIDLDVEVVSLDCDASLLSEAAALPLDSPGRLTIAQRPPLLEWNDPNRRSARHHDLVVFDSLLDDVDDAACSSLFVASLELLRPGGVAWGARFASPLLGRRVSDPSDWASEILRHGGSLRVLDRGPNVWIGAARTGAVGSLHE